MPAVSFPCAHVTGHTDMSDGGEVSVPGRFLLIVTVSLETRFLQKAGHTGVEAAERRALA